MIKPADKGFEIEIVGEIAKMVELGLGPKTKQANLEIVEISDQHKAGGKSGASALHWCELHRVEQDGAALFEFSSARGEGYQGDLAIARGSRTLDTRWPSPNREFLLGW